MLGGDDERFWERYIDRRFRQGIPKRGIASEQVCLEFIVTYL